MPVRHIAQTAVFKITPLDYHLQHDKANHMKEWEKVKGLCPCTLNTSLLFRSNLASLNTNFPNAIHQRPPPNHRRLKGWLAE